MQCGILGMSIDRVHVSAAIDEQFSYVGVPQSCHKMEGRPLLKISAICLRSSL